jgi:hypothetical protein
VHFSSNFVRKSCLKEPKPAKPAPSRALALPRARVRRAAVREYRGGPATHGPCAAPLGMYPRATLSSRTRHPFAPLVNRRSVRVPPCRLRLPRQGRRMCALMSEDP